MANLLETEFTNECAKCRKKGATIPTRSPGGLLMMKALPYTLRMKFPRELIGKPKEEILLVEGEFIELALYFHPRCLPLITGAWR